ncbi:hypothetical protein [Nonomuraea sp. 10N515B]|uniref:hypothetical protein n=1 Tax=Nonomuraea sp. 10N515B TaxID=3457422 RepID=UPI003FCD47DE
MQATYLHLVNTRGARESRAQTTPGTRKMPAQGRIADHDLTGRMITMAMYEFVVHFIGPAGGDALINRLYEAGWDDATIAFDAWKAGGEGFAEFDRESSSAIQAMVHAVMQGEKCGLKATRISDDRVTLGQIAERIGQTLASVDHYRKGVRGPGGFPEPVVPRERAALWSWAEVAEWLHEAGIAEITAEDAEAARAAQIVTLQLRLREEVAGLKSLEDRQALCNLTSFPMAS